MFGYYILRILGVVYIKAIVTMMSINTHLSCHGLNVILCKGAATVSTTVLV